MVQAEVVEMDEHMDRERLMDLLGTVRRAMSTSVVNLSPDTPSLEAVGILRRHRVGGAPVVENGRIVGVATESDLLAFAPHAQTTGPFLRPRQHHTEWCVGDAMTRTVIVASPDEPLGEAVVKMHDAGVDRLPVVDDDGQPVGIIARDDVVRAVAGALRGFTRSPGVRRPALLPD
jgi:CBS domain-containing protein